MRRTRSGEHVKQVSTRLPLAEHKLLEADAARRNLTLSDLIAHCLRPRIKRLREKSGASVPSGNG